MASKRTPEQDEAIGRQITAEVLAGGGNREIARRLNVSPATVSKYKAQALAIDVIDQDFKDFVNAEVRKLVRETLGSMHVQMGCLGDRAWLEEHDQSIFGLAGSYRILGETVGRFLAALDAPGNS